MSQLRVARTIRSIENGDYDDQIKDIARACFERRGVLDGSNYVIEVKRLLPGMEQIRVTQTSETSDYYYAPEVKSPIFVGRVSPSSIASPDDLIHGGKAYPTHELLGKTFYSGRFAAVVRIISVGKKQIGVMYLTEPEGRAAKTAWQRSAKHYIPIEYIEQILGV